MGNENIHVNFHVAYQLGADKVWRVISEPTGFSTVTSFLRCPFNMIDIRDGNVPIRGEKGGVKGRDRMTIDPRSASSRARRSGSSALFFIVCLTTRPLQDTSAPVDSSSSEFTSTIFFYLDLTSPKSIRYIYIFGSSWTGGYPCCRLRPG